jgi:hypothetical protein
MQMHFGRHKGQEIASLPQDYLEWLRDKLHLTGKSAEDIDRALGHEPTRTETTHAGQRLAKCSDFSPTSK